jgi:hypothetical protein
LIRFFHEAEELRLWCDGEESEGGAFGESMEEALLDSDRGGSESSEKTDLKKFMRNDEKKR